MQTKSFSPRINTGSRDILCVRRSRVVCASGFQMLARLVDATKRVIGTRGHDACAIRDLGRYARRRNPRDQAATWELPATRTKPTLSALSALSLPAERAL